MVKETAGHEFLLTTFNYLEHYIILVCTAILLCTTIIRVFAENLVGLGSCSLFSI